MAKADQVVLAPPQNGDLASPSLDDVKTNAKENRPDGDGVSRDARGVKAGQKRGPYKKSPTLEAPEEIITWDAATIGLLGDAPFNLAYATLGPDHEHWSDAKKKAQASYPQLAKAFNDLGIRHPKYLVLTVGLLGYCSALGQAGFESLRISRQAKAEQEKEAKKNLSVA